MEFDEFKEYLFLVSRDVDGELEEFVWLEGEPKISGWLVAIFQDWKDLAAGLPHKQQDKILWRIGGYPLFIGFWLKGSELSTSEKIALLVAAKSVTLSIPELFPPGEPMENGYYMWWYLLVSGITDPELTSPCLEILADLSLHHDERVSCAALHGLGHLQHPGRPAVVEEYIRRHPEAKDDRWVLECLDGTVM